MAQVGEPGDGSPLGRASDDLALQVDPEVGERGRPHLARLDHHARAGQTGVGLLQRRRRDVDRHREPTTVVAPPAVGRLRVVELLAQEAHPAPVGVEVVEHRPLLALTRLGHAPVALLVVGPVAAGRLPAATHPADCAVDVEHLEHRLQPRAVELDVRLQRGRAQWPALRREHLDRLPHQRLPRERQRAEVGPDVAILDRREQYDGGLVGATAGTADLLVVGDRRRRRAHVDHEAECRVEAHAERAGRDQRLDPAAGEVLLEGETLGRVGLAGVRRDVVTARAQVVSDLLRRRHGQAVDDARAGLLGQVVGQPGQALRLGPQPDHAQPQRLAVERAAEHQHVGAQLFGDVVGDPGVGGRGRGQHRDAVGQVAEQGADAPVVGSEVVAPVGDAVRLVDHQQSTGRRQPGQHLVAEAGVVETLGADQQDVDLTGVDRDVDRLPVLDVRRVDRDRADAGPLGGRDLVAHQGQQRRDDHRRPGALRAQQERRHEVDRRLAPAGALDDQCPSPVDGQRLDRGPLVVAEPCVVLPDQSAQVRLGVLADVGGRRTHACMSSSRRRPVPMPVHRSRAHVSTEPGAQLNGRRPSRGGRPGRRRTTSDRGPSAARAGGGRPRRPGGRGRCRGSP